jgi:circadian clock protein KaiC
MDVRENPRQLRKRSELKRIFSGVPRLDYILRGGFVEGGTYTLMGPPGSGKTILANQTCFNHIANEGGRCVYMTLLAETHSKMIRHLETLDFYNSESIASGHLIYLSGYPELKKEGLNGVLNLIRKTIKTQKTTLFVLDGLQAAEKAAKEKGEFDDFLHELQAFVSILNCTALLLIPTHQSKSEEVETVIVDGILELSYQLIGPRAVRELTVHKFRGTNFLLGRHEVEITHEGIQIHPRTEIQFNEPPEKADENRIRMEFGIPRLDQMLHGGLLSGTATTLLGSPGTGKTMLGLAFLVEGAKRGQIGIYFGFYEPPPRLIEKAERIGIQLRKYVDQKMIQIIWQPPLEHYMDALAEQLLEKVRLNQKNTKNRKTRLFIDGAEGFRAAAVYMDRLPRFISAFANQLRTLDVTTLISEELDLFKPEVEMPNPELATVNEGVILVRYLELNSQIHRLISILKMRESSYDSSIREFKITESGIEVADSFESAEEILTGRGKLLHGRWPAHLKRSKSEWKGSER